MGVVEGYSETPYCTADDVARFFRLDDGFISESSTTPPPTEPTQEQVEDMILDWSDEIDHYTKHAWRIRKVEEEYHDLDDTPYYFGSGTPIKLRKRDIITPLDDAQGDKLEVWDGNNWDEWISDPTLTEGRNGEYWVNNTTGQLYIYRRWATWSEPAVRVTYRYGADETDTDGDGVPDRVPRNIRMACAKLVACDIFGSDQYSMTVPGTDGAMNPRDAVDMWEEQAYRTLDRFKEVQWI